MTSQVQWEKRHFSHPDMEITDPSGILVTHFPLTLWQIASESSTLPQQPSFLPVRATKRPDKRAARPLTVYVRKGMSSQGAASGTGGGEGQRRVESFEHQVRRGGVTL